MGLFSKDLPPTTRPASPTSRHDPAAPRTSLIGRNMIFDGTLSGSEPIEVEGTVRGRIQLESDLRVGPSARIEATVHARNVMIEGVIIGDVSADSRVELLASSSVDGNIKAPKIVVAEGARFRGNVDMGSKKPEGDSKEMSHGGNRDKNE